MKCPKCDGELVVSKTTIPEADLDDVTPSEWPNWLVEVDLMCTGEEHHRFFARLHEDDLIEAD